MIPRPDLLDARSPAGIEIFQLTVEPDVPSSHVYMEAQVFTPDSRRFILHRSAGPHGHAVVEAEHRYLVCDLENDGELTPITEEVGVIAPSLAPDGLTLYYFVDETQVGGGKLTLKRVGLDGTERETMLVVDAPLPGTQYRPSRIYPLSTISSDGTRLATSCFLGDGRTEGAPFGLLVFDLRRATVELILTGITWCNMHPQYCRSLDPYAGRDIMLQENHGCLYDAAGRGSLTTSGAGVDIHLVHDDGTNFRDFPWGRDGNEFCQGHQCWIGRTERGLCGTGCLRPAERQLISALPAPHAYQLGIATPGAVRADMSRRFDTPQFCHFATDIAGARLITDHFLRDELWEIHFAKLPDQGVAEPLDDFVYLLTPRTKINSHSHPFLSPDGKLGFFNSDESGMLQAYMIRGLEIPDRQSVGMYYN